MDVSDWKVLIDCGSFSITKDALFFSNVIITFCQCYSRVQMSFLFSLYEWNKLSTDCVTASSVNMFKNKVDTYLRRAGYK